MGDAARTSLPMRLSFRIEGRLWNAYAAERRTMEGALLLGSIAIAAVAERKDLKDTFMDLMKKVFEGFSRDVGTPVTSWDEPTPAPETERGGHA